jgi:hypothetical protein
VHDLNFACPTITFLGADGLYCGGETDPVVCARCLGAQAAFADVDIVGWRARHGELLARAAFLIAPSQWAAAMLARYFPARAPDVIPHGAPGVWASQTVAEDARPAAVRPRLRMGVVLPDDDVPTVAVLGAVGPDKGARRLERMVELVRRRGDRVRFVLIGYLDVQQEPWQASDAVLTVHGRYVAADLPDLLAHYRVRLVAFPSAGPETFSFTLSEAWAAGRPVVVPPFGALAERLADTGAGWSWTDEEWRSEERMLDRIVQLVAPEQATALAEAAARARALPQPTLADMAERTLAHYAAAIAAAAPVSVEPFAPGRVRDALHYVPWAPSAVPSDLPVAEPRPEEAVPAGLASTVARAALRWRHTPAGRVIYALTPARVIDALKSRLS